METENCFYLSVFEPDVLEQTCGKLSHSKRSSQRQNFALLDSHLKLPDVGEGLKRIAAEDEKAGFVALEEAGAVTIFRL